MKAKKVYISGQITGLDDKEARANFKKAATTLRIGGFEPINPMELPHEGNVTWEEFMIEDIITLLVEADAIYMLNGWQLSPGARIEHTIAIETNKEIFYQHNSREEMLGEINMAETADTVPTT